MIYWMNIINRDVIIYLATGSCILLYKEEDSSDPNPLKLEMVGWRGTMSLRAYVPICDAVHYLRLLGADCSKFGKKKSSILID